MNANQILDQMNVMDGLPGNAAIRNLDELKAMCGEEGYLREITTTDFDNGHKYIIVARGQWFEYLDTMFGHQFGVLSTGRVQYYVYRIDN